MAELKLPNINFVMLSGRVVEDAVLRYTPQGTPVSTVRFASDRNFRNAQGAWVKEPLFINLVLFKELAERSVGRLKRGTPLIVEGSLRAREFEDPRTRVKRTVYEIMVRRLHILEKTMEEEVVTSLEEEYPEEVESAENIEPIETQELEDSEKEEDLPF